MLARLKKQIFAEPDDALRRYRFLLRQYWKWDMMGTVMFFILAPLCGYLWFLILVRVANWRISLLARDAEFVLVPPPSWGMPALFFAIPVALFIAIAVLKRLLGDRYTEFQEYSRTVGRYTMRSAWIMVWVLTLVFTITTFFSMNDYVKATQSYLYIRRFGSLRAEQYAFDEILSIQKSDRVKNLKDRIVVLDQPAYAVEFSNDRHWDTIFNGMGSKKGELDRFIEYLSSRSHRPIQSVPFLENQR